MEHAYARKVGMESIVRSKDVPPGKRRIKKLRRDLRALVLFI